MQQATEFPLSLIFAGLGICHEHREAPESPWLLTFALCPAVDRLAFGLRLLQRQLMIPADHDVRLPRTDGIQHARRRAIPAIDNRHSARVEGIMLQALAFLRIADEDRVKWEMHHIDGQGETVISPGGTWALSRSPIA